MTKRLVVTLRADGTVGAETVGMAGSECLDYIGALEELLDAQTTTSQFTADYHATAVADDVSALGHVADRESRA